MVAPGEGTRGDTNGENEHAPSVKGRSGDLNGTPFSRGNRAVSTGTMSVGLFSLVCECTCVGWDRGVSTSSAGLRAPGSKPTEKPKNQLQSK